jgi:hypothetical protein
MKLSQSLPAEVETSVDASGSMRPTPKGAAAPGRGARGGPTSRGPARCRDYGVSLVCPRRRCVDERGRSCGGRGGMEGRRGRGHGLGVGAEGTVRATSSDATSSASYGESMGGDRISDPKDTTAKLRSDPGVLHRMTSNGYIITAMGGTHSDGFFLVGAFAYGTSFPVSGFVVRRAGRASRIASAQPAPTPGMAFAE